MSSTQQELTLDIQGMTCQACALHVTQALEQVTGITSVDIPDWSAKQGTVRAAAGVADETVADAVKTAGYQASIVSRREVGEQLSNPSTDSGDRADYDLIVIGTGGAGMGAAIKAAESGHTCAIIERGVIGGTCVNIGCVPSKALLRAAEAYHTASYHPFTGVHTSAKEVDWNTVIEEKNSLVERLRSQKYVDVINSYPDHITLIQGEATLQADGSVLIDRNQVYRGEKVIIATGARPRILPIKGIDAVEVLTSTSAMDLEHLPRSMVIIGGRFIALEQAQLFARFGTQVTILQRSERLIPAHEPEIAEAIAEYLREEGIVIHTAAKPLAIREEGGEKVVTADMNGEQREFRTEQVLMAVGRQGNTETLNLEAVGVELNERGAVVVDEYMQTSHPNIYAAGDVTDRPQLVYVAAAAGGIATVNALNGNTKRLDLTVLPEVIFTDPQIATVGFTEAQAKKQGYDVKTTQIPLEYVPRALAARNTRGLIKLVADRSTDRLLGAHILAAEAGEVIQTAAMTIHAGKKYGFTVQDMREMLFPYLVQVEGLKLAALTFEKDVKQLSCCAG